VSACTHKYTAKRCYNYMMKNVSTILSHLSSQPQFKYLKRHACYRKYLSLLGTKWQKAIAFVYVKNHTLFIAVTHPGFKMELHYNKDLLKSVLTQMAKHDTSCTFLHAEKVVIFHSKYHSIPQKKEETIPRYHEMAYSNFTIENSDPELKERFETTKRLIQCNR